jgi:protein subunit release factor A
MIDRLTEIEKKIEEISKALTTGSIVVKIANVEELAIDYGRLADVIQSRK